MPGRLTLPEAEIHVWRVPVDSTAFALSRLWPLLSSDERRRAVRLPGGRARRRFVVCRGSLRMIVGGYVGYHPDALTFDTGPAGKPRLDDRCGPTGLRFSVAHAHGLGLVAVGRGREVGVDVELVRPGVAYEPLARRVFSRNERRLLESAIETERRKMFYQLWTRKESFLKAVGIGLSVPLDRVDVLADIGMLSPLQGFVPYHQGWSQRDFEPAPHYVASVTGEGRDWRLESRAWTEGGIGCAGARFEGLSALDDQVTLAEGQAVFPRPARP